MGIYDREYYRDETRGSGWLSGVAPACKALILINVGAFLLEAMLEAPFREALEASPDRIFGHLEIWRLLTAPFLHELQRPFLILFNMLLLWFMGRELESLYGTRDFLGLYLTAAVGGTLAWACFEASRGPGLGLAMIGSSGAVTALAVLYTLYNPRQEVLLFFILPMPMWLLTSIFLGFQVLNFLQGAPTALVLPPLVGAAYGFLFKAADLRWSRLGALLGRFGLGFGRMRRPRLRVIQPEPRERPSVRPSSSSSSGGPTWSPEPAASRPGPSTVVSEEALDARLDEVLAKIAREGRDHLTEDDHRVLQEASHRARNRRSDRI